MSDVQMDTVQLSSHSQRLNNGKPLGTVRCEWLLIFAPCPSEPLSVFIRCVKSHLKSRNTDSCITHKI